MKHFIGLLVAGICLFGFQYYAFSAENFKIGVVDMQRLQMESKTFQGVKDKYRKKAESLQKKLETEKEEVLRLEEEFKKQSMMLSLDAKEDKRKELGKKTRHYKYLQDEFLQQMKEMELETIREVGKDIEKIVQKIGEKEGFLLIIEKRATGFLYSSEQIDITREVIKVYDKMQQ